MRRCPPREPLVVEFHEGEPETAGRGQRRGSRMGRHRRPLRDRLADLTNELIRTNATTAHELACKAAVLLDWLDPQRTDFPAVPSGGVMAAVAPGSIAASA